MYFGYLSMYRARNILLIMDLSCSQLLDNCIETFFQNLKIWEKCCKTNQNIPKHRKNIDISPKNYQNHVGLPHKRQECGHIGDFRWFWVIFEEFCVCLVVLMRKKTAPKSFMAKKKVSEKVGTTWFNHSFGRIGWLLQEPLCAVKLQSLGFRPC